MSTPEQPQTPPQDMPEGPPAPTEAPPVAAPAGPPADQQTPPPTPPAVSPEMTAEEIRAAGLAVDVPWEGPARRPPPIRYGNVASAAAPAPGPVPAAAVEPPSEGGTPGAPEDGVAPPPPSDDASNAVS